VAGASGPGPSSRLAKSGFSAVSVALALALLSGCGKEEAKPQARPPAEVTVVKVEPRDVPITLEYVAQTQSSHEVEIRARVNGFLDKRVYTEGAVVAEGQVLFVMDQKPFQAQVDAAQAALANQKAALETARANLARVKPLAALNAVSQKDLDDATGAYEMAAAQVEMAQANLVTAKLNLSYTMIVAPVAGITAAAMQQDGAYINAQNSQLTTVYALSPIWVNFSLSENELKKLRDEVSQGLLRAPPGRGYVVEVILVDGSIFPTTGKIDFVAPSYNPQTGTFLIRATLANPDGTLRPNQFVRARVHGFTRVNAVLVPQRAVQQGAKGHFTWVVSADKKADYRPVVLGDWNGSDVFVADGLKAGDEVVVDGGLTLRPGEPLAPKLLAATAAPATPPAPGRAPSSPAASVKPESPKPGH